MVPSLGSVLWYSKPAKTVNRRTANRCITLAFSVYKSNRDAIDSRVETDNMLIGQFVIFPQRFCKLGNDGDSKRSQVDCTQSLIAYITDVQRCIDAREAFRIVEDRCDSMRDTSGRSRASTVSSVGSANQMY